MTRKTMRSHLGAEDGQIFPLLALIMLATLAIGIAVFQVGKASALRSDAQTAADAAALAGAKNLRDQLARPRPDGRVVIDQAEVRRVAADYAARNDARLLGMEMLGSDVRVRVTTNQALGDTARPLDAQDERGVARARATMSVLGVGGLAGPPGDPAGGPAPTGRSRFTDAGFEKLAEEIGKPPFSSEQIVILGRFLQEHGLRVSEHPAFGGLTTDKHARYGTADHYNGGAIDVNSPISDAAELPIFDDIEPKLAEIGFNVIWREPNHAPGDNSHMHIDIGPSGIGGGPPRLPALGGGGGDIVTEIRLVPWEGAPTPLLPGGSAGAIPFGPPDTKIACEIFRVGEQMNVSDKLMLAAFETAIVESGVKNLNYGDRESHGVFQQQWTQGWGTIEQTMDPTYASRKFFSVAKEFDRGQPAAILAQDVQRSAYPERYAQRETQARELIANARAARCGGGDPDG